MITQLEQSPSRRQLQAEGGATLAPTLQRMPRLASAGGSESIRVLLWLAMVVSSIHTSGRTIIYLFI